MDGDGLAGAVVEAQMVKPARFIEKSEDQDIDWPADSWTPAGPVVPLYRVVPIIM